MLCTARSCTYLGVGAGAFEGASMTWILDNLMSHPESTLTSVDTLEGGIEYQETDQAGEHDIPFAGESLSCQRGQV